MGLVMNAQLRQRLLALRGTTRTAPGIGNGFGVLPAVLPLGIAAIDTMLGGGLMRGALHEISAPAETHTAAATGFALGLAALGGATRATRTPSPRRGEGWGEGVLPSPLPAPPHPTSRSLSSGRASRGPAGSVDLSPLGRGEKRSVLWIAEEMARAESGAPHGAGLDAFGLAPERLLTVTVSHRRDLLWGMEEALRCRAVGVVIGEMRPGKIDEIAVRRLSLAAGESGALALLLRAAPAADSSTAATRWIVGAASSAIAHGPGAPRIAAHLVRNRRGPAGSWILEWSDSDERFILATHAQPVAAPAFDRPHRQVA